MFKNVFQTYVVKMEQSGGNAGNGDAWETIQYEIVVTDEEPNFLGVFESLSDDSLEVVVVSDHMNKRSAADAIEELEMSAVYS